MDSAKVLFILPLSPPTHGASVVGDTIEASSVIASQFDCRFVNSNTSSSVEEIGKKPLKKITRYFSILFSILKHLIVFRPKVCYLSITASGMGMYKDFPLVMLTKLFGTKTLLHFHNKGVSAQKKNWINRTLYKLIFNRSKVILLSERLYGDISEYVARDNVFICPNGVAGSVEQHEIKAQSESSDVPTILFLSNLIESKGVLVLLGALKILHQKGIDLRCNLVGNEGDLTASDIKDFTGKNGLSDNVEYLGPKYGAEKDEYFSSADIFAFPSFYKNECFPLVLLEAMQHQLPIVTTSEGAIEDIVIDGETGLIVDKRDEQALAGALERLINSSESRLAYGRAGKAKYDEAFTLSHFEERMKGILGDLAQATR